jgi:hypothetical protein
LKKGEDDPDTQETAERDKGKARERAAEMFNTSRQYASDAKKLRDQVWDSAQGWGLCGSGM